MTIKGVFFDFGFVIGYPTAGINRKYFYLDWDGIDAILKDRDLTLHLRPDVGRAGLEAFFEREIYGVFVEHEQTDTIDPQTNNLFLNKLHLVFNCPIDQLLVDQLLAHIDTMKYMIVDAKAMEVVAELKRRGFRLALVSNMMLPGKLLKAKLQEANVLAYFDHITTSSDVGFIKPHPEIFRQTLMQSKLRPDEVIFVGDTYQQDIVGAKRVGLKTVWLNSRHEPRAMARGNPPDYEIETLGELIEGPLLHGRESGLTNRSTPHQGVRKLGRRAVGRPRSHSKD
ncbi:MAG: HAD family hydrolase [Anaerolineae bacterium]|nr:HAD family hydrolase [Anaerolineae bacterium]